MNTKHKLIFKLFIVICKKTYRTVNISHVLFWKKNIQWTSFHLFCDKKQLHKHAYWKQSSSGILQKKASGVKSSVFIPEVSISNVGFVHHIHTYTFIKSNFLIHFTAPPHYLSLLFCLTMTMCHEVFAINVAHLFTTSLYMIQTKTMWDKYVGVRDFLCDGNH